MLGPRLTVVQACKRLEVAEKTNYRWREVSGLMNAYQAKRLRELERESPRLKKLFAGAQLDKATLQEVTQEKF